METPEGSSSDIGFRESEQISSHCTDEPNFLSSPEIFLRTAVASRDAALSLVVWSALGGDPVTQVDLDVGARPTPYVISK